MIDAINSKHDLRDIAARVTGHCVARSSGTRKSW
jgi:hypothetical protein